MNATTAAQSTVRPVDRYTHTTIDGRTGELVHHVVIHTFANLYDTVGTELHYDFRQDDRRCWEIAEPFASDGDGAMSELFLRSRAREVFHAARNMRCQTWGWCHAFCRREQVTNGMLHFCSTPEEIAAVRAVREAEDDRVMAEALAAGYRLA